MDDDQQFCLRWNNHQSTLVAVFDTLLENGTLVDCTLAAEGKCLNAHKVVLSACSPFFEALLSRHFDKHPILILKDVKFQELKAMMDYMYRGEVNISQDQLGALLKAAESLQIKGLSDNRKGENERKPAVPPPPKSPQPTSALPKVQGLTIERSRDDSRDGSQSPGPRKKKRMRRKSEELDNHDASNSSDAHSLPAQNIPSSLPAASKVNADVPESVETKSEILRHKQQQHDEIPEVPIIKEKLETHTELMLEPKSEYVEEMNEDSIEDLTLDDDDLSNMEQMDEGAGPSHGNVGEGSSQGFGNWHMGGQSQDEVFLAAQEAVGAHRDSQEEEYPITLTDLQQLASYDASIKSPAADKRSKKIPKPKSLTLKSKHKKQIVKKKREKENLQPALARIQPVEPKHELAPPIMDKIKSGKEVVEMDDDEEDVPSQHEEENSSSTKVDSRGNLQIQAELMEDELREMIVKFEPELQVDEIESEDNQMKVRPIKVKENARRKATRIRPAVKKIKHKNPELNKKKPKDELNDDQFIEVEAGGSQLNQETAIINEAGSSSKQIRSKRSMEPAKYVCECGKVFKRNQSLNSHRNFVCGKIKTNYCHRCKQFFWAKHQLVQHKKVCMMNFTTAQ